MDRGRECGREVARDDRYIFHLKEKTGEEAQQFDHAFLGELERLEKSEESVMDFTGFVFPGPLDVWRRTFSKPVVFEKAIFSDGARFDRATFLGDARFDEAAFLTLSPIEIPPLGDVWFVGAKFSSDAWFPGATFSSDAVFVTFARVMFRENVFRRYLHMGARFEGLAVFERVLFQRDTIESSDLCALLGPTPVQNVPVTLFSGASVGPNGEVRFGSFSLGNTTPA